MLRILFPLILFILTACSVSGQPFFQFVGYDIDTADQEWSAIGSKTHTLLISTVDEPDPVNLPMGMSLGNIRLRWYSYWENGIPGPTLDTTLLFKGKARVSNITEAYQDEFILSGGYTDTLIFGQDTLINPEPFSLDPFVFKVNRSGQILWHWTVHRPQNNYIHRSISHHLSGYELLAVGIASDTEGWLVSLDPNTGQKRWEEVVSQARTISDAQIHINPYDTSLLITGTCPAGANLFGLNVHNTLPLTGYQTFLYRRDLSNQLGDLLDVASHITFDFTPFIIKHSSSSSTPFVWVTPAVTDTSQYPFGHVQTDFTYDPILNTYDINWRFRIPHSGICYPIPFKSVGSFIGPSNYLVYRSPGEQGSAMEISKEMFPDSRLDIGFQSPYPWLGTYEDGQLWLATVFGNEVTEISVFGTTNILIFPTIRNLAPRWALIRRNEATSVAENRLDLSFDIYPNPVEQRVLHIHFKENVQTSVDWILRDLQGKTVRQGNFMQPEATLILDEIPAGLFIMELSQGKRKSFRKVVLP